MKEGPREQFRWAPHVGGLSVVKPKDYDCSKDLDAPTPYAVWKMLGEEADPLRPGDLLELVTDAPGMSELRIAKYIGFEPAQWYVPEPKPDAISEPVRTTYTAQPPGSPGSAPENGSIAELSEGATHSN